MLKRYRNEVNIQYSEKNVDNESFGISYSYEKEIKNKEIFKEDNLDMFCEEEIIRIEHKKGKLNKKNMNEILRISNGIISIISCFITIFSLSLIFGNYFFIDYETTSLLNYFNSKSFILLCNSNEYIDKIFLEFCTFENFFDLTFSIAIISLIFSILSLGIGMINTENKNIKKYLYIISTIFIISFIIGFIYFICVCSTESIDELINKRMVEEIDISEYCSSNYELSDKIKDEYFTKKNYIDTKEENINKNLDENLTDKLNENLNVVGISVSSQKTEMKYLYPKNCCFYYSNRFCKLPNEGKIKIINTGKKGKYLLKGVYFDVPPMFKLVNWEEDIKCGEIAIRVKVLSGEDNYYIDVCNQNEFLEIHIPNNGSIELQYEIKLNPPFDNFSCFVSFPIYWYIKYY